LSGGLVQRIALARTLLGQPKLLLLDEPTNNLDEESEQTLIRLLKELSTEHTIITATHSPALLALSDSIMVLEQGKVAIAGASVQVIKYLKENSHKT